MDYIAPNDTAYMYANISPNGKKIAYTAHYPGGHQSLSVMNSNGTGRQRLRRFDMDAEPQERETFRPDWSPDSSKIVFEQHYSSSGGDSSRIFRCTLTGR